MVLDSAPDLSQAQNKLRQLLNLQEVILSNFYFRCGQVGNPPRAMESNGPWRSSQEEA